MKTHNPYASVTFALALIGCGGGSGALDGNAFDGGGVDSSVDTAIGEAGAMAVDGGAFAPTPPTGRGGPGTVGVALQVQSVAANIPQVIEAPNGLRLTVPAGALSVPVEARLSTLVGAQPGVPTLEEILAAYDVSLGDQHVFTSPLQIDIPYDTTKLPSNLLIPHEVLLSPAYWDESQLEWVALPYQVDANKGIVTVQTDHLCSFVVRALRRAFSYPAPALIGTLAVTGTEDQVVAYESPGRFIFSFSRAEVAANTGPAVGWYATGDPANPQLGDLPIFAKDAIAYLRHAQDAYAAANFDQPAKQRVFFSNVTSSSRSKVTGDISLRFTSTPKALKADSAHEYFHSVQNTTMSVFGMSLRKWFVEAAADYASDRVAWGKLDAMGGENYISPRYLERSLTYAAPALSFRDVAQAVTDTVFREGLIKNDPHMDHEYTTAFFIDFLVAQKSVDFRSLWLAVASGGINVRSAMDSFLQQNGGTTLASVYRDFARFWAFDATSPVRKRLGKSIIEVADPKLSRIVGAGESSLTITAALDGENSARVISLTGPASGTGRSVTLRAPGLPTDTLVDVYTSSTPEVFKLVGSLSAATDSVLATLGGGTDIYLLAVNNCDSAQSVTVQLTAGPAVTPTCKFKSGSEESVTLSVASTTCKGSQSFSLCFVPQVGGSLVKTQDTESGCGSFLDAFEVSGSYGCNSADLTFSYQSSDSTTYPGCSLSTSVVDNVNLTGKISVTWNAATDSYSISQSSGTYAHQYSSADCRVTFPAKCAGADLSASSAK